MRPTSLLLAVVLGLGPVAGTPVLAQILAQTEGTDLAGATANASIAALTETMKIGPLFEVLGEEGIAYGKSLEEDMFPGSGGAQWTAAVAAIYDVPALRQRFETALSDQLASDPATITEIIAFFGSDLGQRILSLEIDARRAFLDDGVEEAAQVTADTMRAKGDPRIDLLTRLAEANDLIEMNVAGSLTGSLAFLQGMTREGLQGSDADENQMMSDVWGQEEQVRADTTTWLYSYLALAYQPLSDADLEAYIAFSQTPAGKKLNAALFSAFDVVFTQVSYDLGRAAIRAMQGSDI
ncbi:DUF2059 domain-containing protein [Tabrizicola sp. BL-A-41-H6]|uniref:DUF2059 domain-containing protein n=1 Tax=Tabrizicola sp. BL-A-41-H6 TaxID=3421107 RepID=UPI003D67FA1C